MRGEDPGLVGVGVAHAHFAHPLLVAQPGAAFGQRSRDDFAGGQTHGVRRKLGFRPRHSGKLVVGENGDAFVF